MSRGRVRERERESERAKERATERERGRAREMHTWVAMQIVKKPVVLRRRKVERGLCL